MAKFLLTKKAVEDLVLIWNYTYEEWSETQADKYYEDLLANCKAVSNNPKIGKLYDMILPNLYGLKVNRHIIFYRIIDKSTIEITRILHGKMDLRNRLNR